MKNTRKILLAIVLVLTMLVGMTAITAFAAGETYTVAGEAGLCGGNGWETDNTANDMTYDESTGIYTKEFENIAAGTYQYKVVKNHAWGEGEYPTNNVNNVVTVPEDGVTVRITWNPATSDLKATILVNGEELVPTLKTTKIYVKNTAGWDTVYCYYWGGSNVVSWPGTEMTYDSESGLWTFEIPSDNANCIFNDGSGTQTSDLATPTNDAVLFDNSTNAWTTLEGDVIEVEHTYTVAGSDSTGQASIFGQGWAPAYEANDMTLGEDGIYTKTFENVPAGSYKFKICKDDAWADAVGDPNSGDADGNYLYTVQALCNLTIKFDGTSITVVESEPSDPNAGADVEKDPVTDYYLVGYINGEDYNGEGYHFVDNKITATFTADSYVVVKDNNGDWYLSAAYCTDTEVDLAMGNGEKMFVAKEVEYTFTLVVNDDGTLTLSYAEAGEETPDDPTEKPDTPTDKPADEPTDEPTNEPEPELNFFEKIWQAILDFFKSIGGFFGNLFGGNKE